MRATFRFYAELNDHLALGRQYRSIEKEFLTRASVKDLIESFGVPHTEVELIVVNGESCDFARLIADGDRVAVYPVFEAVDITPELRVRLQPLRQSKFVLDVHLGRLAAYLRMLGFDTAYRSCASDPELAETSVAEKRILLTRDRGLLMRSAVTHGYWLRETDSRRQVAEVLGRFDLFDNLHPFTRCMACNQVLCPATREAIRGQVPASVATEFEDFHECPRCRRVYWQGTHYRRMKRWIAEMEGAQRMSRSTP